MLDATVYSTVYNIYSQYQCRLCIFQLDHLVHPIKTKVFLLVVEQLRFPF